MSERTRELSADELVAELNAIGLHFVTGEAVAPRAQPFSRAKLLAGLAAQSNARMRLAIIALLLYQPDYASAVPDALEQSTESARITLKFYYTAALLLQQEHAGRLHQLLGEYSQIPDRYAEEFKLSAIGTPQERLKRLAERHSEITGLQLNWLGTYRYAAERLIKRLEFEAQWAI